MTRDEYSNEVRQLIDEGARLQQRPSLEAMRDWIARSDELLRGAWGSMDRYHLSWLMVGRPADAVRGRAMSAEEEAAYVRDVAGAKTAALQMSLKAVAEDGMPFKGETAG
ncbi:MAG: hypothetical protein ACC726_02685 [Chloroflexota bacterium]